jgi:hypothetical protein
VKLLHKIKSPNMKFELLEKCDHGFNDFNSFDRVNAALEDMVKLVTH